MTKRLRLDAAGADTGADTLTTMDGVIDEKALLRRHLAGDPDAFAEIFRAHRDHLWAVALRTIGDADEAADALQDALLSAMRHAASFRGDAKVSTWLHRIVVNACLDRLRRKAARPTVVLPDDDHAPASSRDEYADKDLAADVNAALRCLPVDQRAAIVLVDIEGYPVNEVAEMLGVPTGTVKSRCARGRAKLVPLLAHLKGGATGPGSTDFSGNLRSDGNVESASVDRPASARPFDVPPFDVPPLDAPREDLR